MSDRQSWEENCKFIEETVARLDRNEVCIDELEGLAIKFADARRACEDRLTRIEQSVQSTLASEQTQPAND